MADFDKISPMLASAPADVVEKLLGKPEARCQTTM